MTEMVIETSVQYVHLTRLIAREYYIKFTLRESTKTYTNMLLSKRNEQKGFCTQTTSVFIFTQFCIQTKEPSFLMACPPHCHLGPYGPI
jgi:hypothetical protein